MITKIGLDLFNTAPLTDEDKQLFREEYGLPEDADIDTRKINRQTTGVMAGCLPMIGYGMYTALLNKNYGRGIAGIAGGYGLGAIGMGIAGRKYSKSQADKLREKRMQANSSVE